jgi:hypothetical protein
MVRVPPKRATWSSSGASPHHHGDNGLPKFSRPFSSTIVGHARNKNLKYMEIMMRLQKAKGYL